MHDAGNGEHNGSDATKGSRSMRLLNLVAAHNGKHDFHVQDVGDGEDEGKRHDVSTLPASSFLQLT
jgi:hypothetical protein